LQFNSNAKVTSADDAAAAKVMWTGDTVYHGFANTAEYPPIGYLPQTLGIVVGRITGMSVVHTLLLSRLLNGALAIFISTFALYWCRRGKLILFALLLMPMTMALFGSCSQDAALISFTALAFSIVSRQIAEGVPLSPRMTIVLAAALLMVTSGRPPYAPLLLVLLVPGLLPRWGNKPAWMPGVSLASLLLILTLIWWLASSSSFGSTRMLANGVDNHDANPGMQIVNMCHHPGIFPGLMSSMISPATSNSFIGVLGWLDTVMPRPYYMLIELMLLIAVAGELVYRNKIRKTSAALILLAGFFTVAGVFLSLYLLWSPIGSRIVWCFQGRYLIPAAIAASVGLPCLYPSERGYRWATVAVVLGQLLTFFYLPMVLFERYYMITEQPSYITERLYFADSLEAQGKLDEAAQEYRQVLAAMPNLYSVHNGLGNVYDGKGMTQDALREYRLSLAMKPDQATPHFKIGRILAAMHQYPEAVEEYSQALQFDPANANIHNDLGVILYQLGKYEKAAEEFSDAIRIDPAHTNARKNLDIAEAKLNNKSANNGRK
jgi:uncharacterized membrane protein/Tfp pilus assembly protein PilF